MKIDTPRPPSRGCFVTGTDTNVGKTVVTAALLRALRHAGLNALGVKPVQTGIADNASAAPGLDSAGLADIPDACRYEAATGVPALTLESFRPACSPHLAAEMAGRVLRVDDLARRLEALNSPFIVAEGAGGLYVPLSRQESTLNLMVRLGWPVVLVAANKLGCVNHILLSLAALRAHNLNVAAVVFTQPVPFTSPQSASPQPTVPPSSVTHGQAGVKTATTPEPRQAHKLDDETWLEQDNMRTVRDHVELVLELPHKAALHTPLPPLAAMQHDDHARQKTCQNTAPAHAEQAAWADLAEHLAPLAQNLIQSLKPEAAQNAPHEAAKTPGTTAGTMTDTVTGTDIGHLTPLPPLSERELLDFDSRHLWHPYTSALHPLPVYEAVSAQGTRIRLRNGRDVVDGMASWWCAIHGYAHPKLVAALRQQAETMPHVMFGGLTHRPAVDVARRLLPMLPKGLEHIFLADSGSVSVEVALKMALQYWQAQGKTGKTRFITPRGGYHGDTLGAMSVCDPLTGMHSLFSGMLPRQIFVPRPACRFAPPSDMLTTSHSPSHAADPATLRPMEEALARHAHEVAAVILEPIVQGAGGMWFYHPDYLHRLRALCDQHNVLLILDEIATGFGRTGKFFAAEWAGISPDILCLGKGLSGGVMTLAATTTTRQVAEGISADNGVFMHGPTFMGNPLACAAACASLDVLASGAWRTQVPALEQAMRQGLAPCRDLTGVSDVRVLGSIGVVELEKALTQDDISRLQAFFVARGVWLRPFGRVIYMMPPYIARQDDIELLTSTLHDALKAKVHLQ